MNAGMLMSGFPLWTTIGKFYWESQSLAEGYLWDIRFLALLHVGCKMKSAQAESCRTCSKKVWSKHRNSEHWRITSKVMAT